MDLDMATVPTFVNLNGLRHYVVAAVFKPGGYGLLDSHIVVYPSRIEGLFNVHYLVHDDDGQRSTLHMGSYDLSYPNAVAEMMRRFSL